MDCSEANSQLSALVSGGLAAEDEASVREHLESCEECLHEYEKLRGTDPVKATPANSAPDPAFQVSPLAPPPPSDWTVEKIFGDAPSAPVVTTPAPAAPAAAATFHDVALPQTQTQPAPPVSFLPPAAPSTPHPSLIPPLPGPEEPAKGSAKPGTEAWGFEPADAARDATPPEESLLFAEQALNRRIDASGRKNAAIRAFLWIGGAVVGVALLGVSLWMAMEDHGAQPREIAARVKPSAGASTTVTHSAPSDKPVAAGTETAVPDPATATTEDPQPAPAAASSTPAPAPIKAALTTGGSAKSANPSAAAAKVVSKSTGTSVTSGERTASSVSKTVAPPPTKEPSERAPAPTITVKRDDDDMWPVDDPIRASGTGKGSTPPKSATTSPTIITPAPKVDAKASGNDGAPEAPSPVAPAADMKPIDRIHAATVQAAKDQDILALRRLKLTWKNLARTVVGPERSRAKREYAECLWDIQALSGRDADQRETLAAYRDFLLNAPAGGADAKSASRLRELEDALSERH